MPQTHFLGIRDPGRSGGSWVMHLCHAHPSEMRLLGEPHLPMELDFKWPGISAEEYDNHTIEFLKSQAQQGIAVAGIIKCFRPWCADFILQNGGRILALVRNPMEVLGSNMGKKVGADILFLGHKANDANEQFKAHALYYRTAYMEIWQHRQQEPITRIEDYTRSCGGDGRYLKTVMEWATQTEWPSEYIAHIQKYYLPGYFYGSYAIKENGIVVGIRSEPVGYEPWRMNWYDDPRAGEHWVSWSELEHEIFAEVLGPVCDNLGYNYRSQPGHVDKDWSLLEQYAWKEQAAQLKPIPYEGTVEIRASYPHGEHGLPKWEGAS